MNDMLTFVLGGMAGLVLGAVFFGGLLWTIRRGVASPHPALWFFSSLMLRTGIVLAGFYGVGHDDWRRLMVCLTGFVVARIVVIWITRPALTEQPHAEEEAGHAP